MQMNLSKVASLPAPSVLILGGANDLPELHLMRGLVERGFNIAYFGSARAEHLDFFAASGITYYPATIRSRLDLKCVRRLRTLLKKNSFHILHALTARALTVMLFASMGLGQKRVAYRGTVGNLSRLDPSSWLSFLHPKIDRISCVSEAVRRYLITQGVSAERAVTIYKGHSTEWYQQQPIRRSELRIPENAFLIGCTANMRHLKGVDLLIRAFGALPKEAHLVLVGEIRDPLITDLLATSPARARIHALGFRADAASIIASCNVSVMFSREREGFPKAVIESMIQGISAIVSDAGGMPEMVEEGVSGLIVPAGDQRALAEALRRLFHDRDLCTRMGVAARARVLSTFSIDQTIAKTAQLYRELLA
jgi:L-malate glycosyltransferase